VIDKAEAEGFENYVRQHYREAIHQARSIILTNRENETAGYGWNTDEMQDRAVIAVFDKLATPKVFLIQMWKDLSDNQRLSYYSKDYQDKAKKDAEALSRKVEGMISQ
jgi:hypothetical protein